MAGTAGSHRPLALLLLLLPPSLADVPPIDRARPHFYGAVADQPVTVAWAVAPAGGDIALTLAITGVANPAEVRKPDVKPLLAGRFQVLAAADPPPAAGAVRFAYTLRPVPGGVPEVPALRFAYYRPGFPDGRRFQTAYAEPLAVTASSPPAVASPPTPPAVPAAEPGVPGWAWLVPVGLVPPLVLAGAPLARRLYPDAARRAELRRVKAVRDALDALAAAQTDPARITAAAVRAYLAARPSADTAAFADLLARCDAARFGPASDGGVSLPAEAAALVRAAEAGR